MRGLRTWKALLTAGSLAFATGCGAPRLAPPRVDPPTNAETGDAAVDAQFAQSLARWTRRAEIYDRLDARIFFVSTALTPSFRLADLRREAALHGLPPEKIEAVRPIAPDARADGPWATFFVSVYANDSRFDDFSNRESLWTILLRTRSAALFPAELKRIDRPDAQLRARFPYLDRFWTAYFIRFPRVLPDGTALDLDAGDFSLEFSSVLGRAVLDFSAP